jgi:hypothetical protein
MTGQEAIRASWLTEVAILLDDHEIRTESLMIGRGDIITVTTADIAGHQRLLNVLGIGLGGLRCGKARYRGLIVRVIRSRRLAGGARRPGGNGDGPAAA